MTVFIVDNFPLMREALASLLRRLQLTLNVVQLDRFAALPAAFEMHGLPSLICLEIDLPDTQGVSGIIRLKSKYPDVPVVVFSGVSATTMKEGSLNAGAVRYIEKSTDTAELSMIFNQLLNGKEMVGIPSVYHPTKRQLEVLGYIDRGFANQAIADAMGVSLFTINVHLNRLFGHIKVKNRTQAVLYARKHNFIA